MFSIYTETDFSNSSDKMGVLNCIVAVVLNKVQDVKLWEDSHLHDLLHYSKQMFNERIHENL